MTSETDPIEELLAKQAITEVIYRYCRALDRMDRPLADTIWHAGGTADYGPTMFQGTGEGFLDWVWPTHAAMLGHSHQIANVLIEVDGDHAGSEAYVTATLWAAFAPDELTQIIEPGPLRRPLVATRRRLGDRPPPLPRGLHDHDPAPRSRPARPGRDRRATRSHRPVARRPRALMSGPAPARSPRGAALLQ